MTQMQKASSGLTVKLVSEMTGYAPADIALVSRTVAQGAPLQELAVFLHSCRSLGLDPLLRQAYWIRRGSPPKGALQVGIDGFRAIAESSGTYAGAEPITYRGQIEWAYKDRKLIVPELAQAIVWKVVAGHKSAFTGEAYWTEFVPSVEKDAFMWARMPRHMLGKVAEAQALRRAFPASLGALNLDSSGALEPQSLGLAPEAEPEAAPPPKATQKQLAARYAEIYDYPDLAEPSPEAEEPDDDDD